MYYPINAVKKLAARYAAIKDQGNQEELQQFTEQMLARRKAIIESVKGFKEWEEGYRLWSLSVLQANRKTVHEKLEALGHLPVDFSVSSIMNSKYVETRTPLTEARWAVIRPHIESLVIEAKERRIEEQRRRAIVARQVLGRGLIQSYIDQRPRLEAAFRPTAQEVLTKNSVFTDIIEQPDEVSVSAQHFEPAMEALPTLLKEEMDLKKKPLVHRMVEGGAENVSDPPVEEDLDKVFYATTVFFSKTSRFDIPICVDREFKERMCWLFKVDLEAVDTIWRRLTFDPKASDAVGALLRCARLEYTTTVEDMDALDLRFYCLGCEGWERKLARTETSLARLTSYQPHFKAQHAKEAKHNTDNWHLLDDETASKVRVAERSNLKDRRPRFYCNRCGFGLQTRKYHALGDLVKHLKTQ
ncbi:hypothetical protein FRC00_002671 [Tulasnella sp. 408]|nr:hypothetical protein FRC00_002671 [Tulasnella sp. 408]